MKLKATLAIVAASLVLTTSASADETLGKEALLSKGDYYHNITGKSGKTCAATCLGQPTVEACRTALTADGCDQARDKWREQNPDKRRYEKGARRF